MNMVIEDESREAKFALVILYNDEGIYLFQRKNPNKTIYLLYQVPRWKVEKGETARQRVVREVYEETGISLKPKRLRFIVQDPKYQCNIYSQRINNVIPERKESEEMSEW